MKKQHLPYVILGIITVVVLAYFMLTGERRNQFQWNESYGVTSDQPYGTKFIQSLLQQYGADGSMTINKDKPLHQILQQDEIKTGTDYYFIGQSLYLDTLDRRELMRHVEAGSHAFISSLDPPSQLLEEMHIDLCEYQIRYNNILQVKASMNFFNDSLRAESPYVFSYRHGPADRPYNWSFMDDNAFCDEMLFVPLGFHRSGTGDDPVTLVNFIKIPFGQGAVYLHSNPIVFTNYFVSKEETLPYLSGVFSHMKGRHAIWDEYSKLPYSINKNTWNSPLSYLLEQPALKYAWYLMVITVLLYVFFTARRTQRIIPVLEEKANTSLAFVRLIATLHFENGNHLDMAKKKLRYLLFFIRSRYGIHAHELNGEVIQKLAERSGVSITDIETIAKLSNSIEHQTTYQIDEFMLMNLYQAVDHFYKQCK